MANCNNFFLDKDIIEIILPASKIIIFVIKYNIILCTSIVVMRQFWFKFILLARASGTGAKGCSSHAFEFDFHFQQLTAFNWDDNDDEQSMIVYLLMSLLLDVWFITVRIYDLWNFVCNKYYSFLYTHNFPNSFGFDNINLNLNIN